jgi:hypothetical protein
VPVPAGEAPGGGRDPERQPRWTRPAVGRVALLVAGAAYSLVAASTTAFTGAANLVTALPIVAMAALVIALWPLRAEPRPPRRRSPADADGPRPQPWRAWVVLFAAILLWELAEYAARGSRADHPTLSSMLDTVDRDEGLKALVFFLWLYLGAAIVRRGRRCRDAVGRDAGPS